MSLEAVKALVKRAFADEAFKDRLLSQPEATLSTYDLTAEEREAIRQVHGRVGMVTGTSGELAAALQPLIDWYAPTP